MIPSGRHQSSPRHLKQVQIQKKAKNNFSSSNQETQEIEQFQKQENSTVYGSGKSSFANNFSHEQSSRRISQRLIQNEGQKMDASPQNFAKKIAATYSQISQVEFAPAGRATQMDSDIQQNSLKFVIQSNKTANEKSSMAESKAYPISQNGSLVSPQNPLPSESNDHQEEESLKPNNFYSLIFSHCSPSHPRKQKKRPKILTANVENLVSPEVLRHILKKQQEKTVQGPLVIDQIGIAGIPSLWMSSHELQKQGYLTKDSLRLLVKYHKMFAVLRCHRRWENEKMFGRNLNAIVQAGQAPVEFQYFSNSKLVSKYNENEITLKQNEQFAQQIPLLRQYIRSFFPPGSQGTSQYNYVDSENATYKMVNSDKQIIKQILETNHVQPAAPDSQAWSLLWSCNALVHKQQAYEHLIDYQKINHFLNSTQLTRKDRLYINYMRLQEKFGNQEFNFLPETFVLPEQTQEFRDVFYEYQGRLKYIDTNRVSSSNTPTEERFDVSDNIWIVKPASSSRGRGIFILSDLKDLPKEEGEFVVSKYISNPFLISGHKFDLRVYVLITSVDPLKIYVFNEGLVRFASEPYSKDFIKAGKFSHLTNYSINKKSENFVQNKTAQQRDVGNKWSMSALQHHLSKLGIDFKPVWHRIYDMIIKSLVSVESQMMCSIKKPNPNSSKPSNCFELLGFDILLDSDLKPWILEVNLAPSLTADSPLDFHIKSNLIVDFFNLAGIRRPLKRNGKPNLRQTKVKSNSVAHNAEIQVQAMQTQQRGFNIDQSAGQTVMPSKEHMSSQTKLIKGTTQTDVVGRNNMRKGNGTLSQGIAQGSNFISYVDYGMNVGNSRKLQIAGGQMPPVQLYDGVEVQILQKISKVSAKHRALLYETLWEFERNTRLNFTRIFPSPGSCYYDKFFDQIRPNNTLIYKYLCQRTELWAIIEQSTFNDIENGHNPDQWKDVSVQENTYEQQETEIREQSVQEQEAPTEFPKVYEPVEEIQKIITSSPANQELSAKAQFMERRKTMSRKLPSMKPHEDITMPPLLTAQNKTYDLVSHTRRDTNSQVEESINEISHGYEEDAISQESAIQIVHKSQTLDPISSVGFKPSNRTTLAQVSAAKIQSLTGQVGQVRNRDIEETTVKPIVDIKPIVNNSCEQAVHPQQVANPEFEEKLQTEQKAKLPIEEKPKAKLNNQENLKSNIEAAIMKTPQIDKIVKIEAQQDCKSPKSDLKPDTKSATVRVEAKSPKMQDTARKEILSNERFSNQKNKQISSQTRLRIKEKEPLNNNQVQEKPSESKTIKEKRKKQKVVITGDDILIEYVRRIKNALKKYPISSQPSNVHYYLQKFLYHKVWSLNDQSASTARMREFNNGDLRLKLKIRYVEMKSRRESVNALDKTIEQRALANKESTQQYIERINKLRDNIVSALSSTQVEQMVIQSNQQNPIEIVSYLVGKRAENGGLLTRIEKYGQKAQEQLQKLADDTQKLQSIAPQENAHMTKRHQLSSSNADGQVRDVREQVRMISKAVKKSQYFSTIEKHRECEKKASNGLENINTKRGPNHGQQPMSMLEQHDFQRELINLSFNRKEQESLLQSSKSPKFKNQKLPSGSASNSAHASQNFYVGVPDSQIETIKSSNIVKNAYNSAYRLRISQEEVDPADFINQKTLQLENSKFYLSDPDLYQNRFNAQHNKCSTQMGLDCQQYEDKAFGKKRTQQQTKLSQAQQNKNMQYTNLNTQITKLVSTDSNKSLSQFKQVQQSPINQFKSGPKSQAEGKQPRLGELTKAGLDHHDILSDQFTLKNQQLNNSSCDKPVQRKTTVSVDRPSQVRMNDNGRNFVAENFNFIEDQRSSQLQKAPPQCAALILPRIDLQGQNMPYIGFKQIDNLSMKEDNAINPSVSFQI